MTLTTIARRMILAVTTMALISAPIQTAPAQTAPARSPATPANRTLGEDHDLNVSVEFQPLEPTLADLVEMTITADAAPGVIVRPLEFAAEFGDFRVRQVMTRPLRIRAGREVTAQTVILEPLRGGNLRLLPLTIVYQPAGESQPLVRTVAGRQLAVGTEVDSDTVSLDAVDEQVAPLPPPSRIGWTLWFAIAAVSTLLIGGLVWMRRRAATSPTAAAPPASETARDALDQLERTARGSAEASTSESAAERDADFFGRLASVLRTFLVESLSLDEFADQTTDEFLRSVSAHLDQQSQLRLSELLQAADEVRFARQPTSETTKIAALEEARRWIKLVAAPDVDKPAASGQPREANP